MTSRAFIAGCLGTSLTADERAFFRDARPWGFIVFKRNTQTPEQTAALTAEMRETVGWHAPILIDQEGGRVQRMGPPNWPKYQSARAFLAINDVELDASSEHKYIQMLTLAEGSLSEADFASWLRLRLRSKATSKVHEPKRR